MVEGCAPGPLAIDEQAPFFLFDGLRKAGLSRDCVNGAEVTTPCRMIKSPAEIALLQRAKEMTLEVQKAAARILTPGMRTTEVADFIDKAHRAVGAPRGSTFAECVREGLCPISFTQCIFVSTRLPRWVSAPSSPQGIAQVSRSIDRFVSGDGPGARRLPRLGIFAGRDGGMSATGGNRVVAFAGIIGTIHCPAGDCEAICREGAVTEPMF